MGGELDSVILVFTVLVILWIFGFLIWTGMELLIDFIKKLF